MGHSEQTAWEEAANKKVVAVFGSMVLRLACKAFGSSETVRNLVGTALA